MAYHIDFHETLVLGYLAGLADLSDKVLADMLAAVQRELGENADEHLHRDPVGDEGWMFRYQHRHHDPASGQTHTFQFICDADYRLRLAGVIRVRFVDHSVESGTG